MWLETAGKMLNSHVFLSFLGLLPAEVATLAEASAQPFRWHTQESQGLAPRQGAFRKGRVS